MPVNEREKKFDLSRMKQRSSGTINYYLQRNLAKIEKADNTPCWQGLGGHASPMWKNLLEEPSIIIYRHFESRVFSASIFSQTHKNPFARALTVARAQLENKTP